ncbi:hypothetical protein BH18ACI4_BH18ACI4_06800 [soil metagenome]
MALADDASAVASVLLESFVEYKSSYTNEGFNATTPTSDQLRNRMTEGPVWVALHNGAIVGTASAVSQGEALYIRGMAVLPAARGHKVGELLLKAVESYAMAHGCKSLILSTTPFLSRAIRLYEQFGFRRSGVGPHNLFGTPLFTMVKNLSRPELKERDRERLVE